MSSSPKTILFVAETFYPDRAISAIRITEWCRHLPEFGWKPVVLCKYFGTSASREELAHAVHPEVDVHYFNRPSAASPNSGAAATASRDASLVPPLDGKKAYASVDGSRPRNSFLATPRPRSNA